VSKSKVIRLTAVMAASAAALSACDRGESGSWDAPAPTWTCVDNAGVRVEDGRCNGGGGGGGYHAYYFGSGMRIPPVGERASDGSYAPAAGVTYTRASASYSVTRGGFGGTAEGHGGGDGGAGE
jgi:hypothetical protein